MTDINIGAITESLNYKSDLDLGNTSPQLVDYIVEQQLPSADNNYTWYNKYKSGRVEQGGKFTATSSTRTEAVLLPVEMADTNYHIQKTIHGGASSSSGFNWNAIADCSSNSVSNNTTTVVNISVPSNSYCIGVFWEVKGMSAGV